MPVPRYARAAHRVGSTCTSALESEGGNRIRAWRGAHSTSVWGWVGGTRMKSSIRQTSMRGRGDTRIQCICTGEGRGIRV
eukprot:1191631-Rhodomonas_salina.4